MKSIKMKDPGESPEFGAFTAGAIFDESRIDASAMEKLVKRGVAEWVENKTKTIEEDDHGK